MPKYVEHPQAGIVEFPDGMSDVDITNALVKIDADLGKQYENLESFYRASERGFTSTARGIEQGLTGSIADGSLTEVTDEQAEAELRVMLEQNPLAGYSGLLLGSIADPVTLPFAWTKLIKAGNILGKAFRGAGVGATAGFLEPTYDKYGDSVAMNIMMGGGIGASLGGAAGIGSKLYQRATSVDLEDAGDGLVRLTDQGIEKISKGNKLSDEVNQALDDADVAAITARVEESFNPAQGQDLIEDAAKFIPQEAKIAPPPARTGNPEEILIEELIPLASKALPNSSLKEAQKNLDIINKTIQSLEKKLTPRTSVRIQQAVEEKLRPLKTEQARLQDTLNAGRSGNTAQAKINKIKSGQTDKLPKETRKRLEELRGQLGVGLAKPKLAQATQESTSSMQRVDETTNEAEQLITILAQKFNAKLDPIETRSVNEESYAPLRSGLDAPESAGSMGVRPALRFGLEDAPENSAVQRAVFGKGVPPQDRFTVGEAGAKTPTQVTGTTTPELNFHSRLQAESSEQLIRLRNETHRGRYSWNNISEGAVKVEEKILEDYDDLVSWLADNEGRLFKADELEMLTPLIQEAQQRMFDARKILFSLAREGKLDSEETVQVLQDIQFYNYIGNVAYISQKTLSSNVMTQLRRMKKSIALQEGSLARGKAIDDIMFGVKC